MGSDDAASGSDDQLSRLRSDDGDDLQGLFGDDDDDGGGDDALRQPYLSFALHYEGGAGVGLFLFSGALHFCSGAARRDTCKNTSGEKKVHN